jgi:hypothetical protein
MLVCTIRIQSIQKYYLSKMTWRRCRKVVKKKQKERSHSHSHRYATALDMPGARIDTSAQPAP